MSIYYIFLILPDQNVLEIVHLLCFSKQPDQKNIRICPFVIFFYQIKRILEYCHLLYFSKQSDQKILEFVYLLYGLFERECRTFVSMFKIGSI